MDLATLALTAAGLVAKKALDAVGDQAGKSSWQALGRIAQTVRGWLAGDHEATETLDRLEAKPDSQARAAELAEILQPWLEADERLAAQLTRLVEEAKTDPQTASFVTTVEGNARVGKLTNIGQITGDVHF
jgi:hypothetical protein